VQTKKWFGSASPVDASGLSQDNFRFRILEERRLEFAYEFKRWYDIARRRMADAPYNVFDAVTGLESEISTEDGVGPGEKFFDSTKDYLLPLPQADLNVTPSLLPNNPGY